MVQEQSAIQTSVGEFPMDINAPTVNRRRERRIYYRPHYDKQGRMIGYFPTLPLPADAWHINYYSRKGFKLEMPRGELPASESVSPPIDIKRDGDTISCPIEDCAKVVNSFLGLARHMARVHNMK